MPPRSLPEQLRFLARARAGTATVAEVNTTRAIDLDLLARALGCWYMVDHQGLEAGKPKTVFAACTQGRLEDVLRTLPR